MTQTEYEPGRYVLYPHLLILELHALALAESLPKRGLAPPLRTS